MSRTWLAVAGCVGALGVSLGAFGAHGLQGWLAQLPDGEVRLGWWRTATQYHLWHALALCVCAVSGRPGRAARLAPWAFAVGITLFSGSLYVMTLNGVRALGAITPLGGLCLIAGWLLLAASAVTKEDG